MKILVVSDTHKDFEALKRVFEAVQDADTLVHLGDGENEFEQLSKMYPQKAMIYVCGNCDYGNYPGTHIIQACGIRIFCTHGHRFGVGMGLEHLAQLAKMNGCKAALYGHTHVRYTGVINGVQLMNPGSPSCPRGGNKPSYGILEVSDNGDINMNIVDCKYAGKDMFSW